VDLRTEHAIERRVIVPLADSQAERMALGRAKYLGSGLDFFEAIRYAGFLCRTRPEMSAYLLHDPVALWAVDGDVHNTAFR
jgi:hypothetical protein